MKTKEIQKVLILVILIATVFTAGCGQNSSKEKQQNLTNNQKQKTTDTKKQNSSNDQVQKESNYKVTFIELGSKRCVPCQKMQPIMKSIEEKYPDQVKVVFHDVWTPEGRPYANKYNINVIPTQVFLDENGNEYFRHKGFFPEEELMKVLKQKGVE